MALDLRTSRRSTLMPTLLSVKILSSSPQKNPRTGLRKARNTRLSVSLSKSAGKGSPPKSRSSKLVGTTMTMMGTSRLCSIYRTRRMRRRMRDPCSICRRLSVGKGMGRGGRRRLVRRLMMRRIWRRWRCRSCAEDSLGLSWRGLRVYTRIQLSRRSIGFNLRDTLDCGCRLW